MPEEELTLASLDKDAYLKEAADELRTGRAENEPDRAAVHVDAAHAWIRLAQVIAGEPDPWAYAPKQSMIAIVED